MAEQEAGRGRDWYVEVEFSDGARFGIPVKFVALHRAEHYAHEFDGDVERSLEEDTLPLFRQDDYEIVDWLTGSFNWSDVKPHASYLGSHEADYEREFVNAPKRVVSTPTPEAESE